MSHRKNARSRIAVICACAAALVAAPTMALADPADPQAVQAAAAGRAQLLHRVFLGGSGSSDAQSGADAASAVATFEHAKSLLAHDGQIVLQGPITIDGRATLSLEGKGSARVVRGNTMTAPMIMLEPGADLTLEHIVFDGALPGENVNSIIAAQRANCKLTLDDGCTLENNAAPSGQFGTAIVGWKGLQLVMNDGAVVQDNSARSAGYGAIMLANGGSLIMNGGTIRNNDVNRGGAVALLASSMTMNGGVIEGNRAHAATQGIRTGYGGAIYVSNWEAISGLAGFPNAIAAGDASFVMNGGSIKDNTSQDQGGAILTFPAARTGDIAVEINGGLIAGNKSERNHGGAIGLYAHVAGSHTTFKMTGGEISGNSTPRMGGALFLYDMSGDHARMEGGVIKGNEASSGGGIAAYGSSVWTMTGGSIEGNQARWGGGVYLEGATSCVMSGGSIEGNNAGSGQLYTKGDGIYQGGSLEVSAAATINANNDVYLPSGHIIDVVAPYAGATRQSPCAITSRDLEVEPRDASTPGTKLVRYHDAAGGEAKALEAQRNQCYVPSAKMLAIDPSLYIGKSSHAGQPEFMTYIARPASHVVQYEFEGEVPFGAAALLPHDVAYVTGEQVAVAPAPSLEGYRFSGWKTETPGVDLIDGAFVMPESDVLFKAAWEKLPDPVNPDPGGDSGNPGDPAPGGEDPAQPDPGDDTPIKPGDSGNPANPAPGGKDPAQPNPGEGAPFKPGAGGNPTSQPPGMSGAAVKLPNTGDASAVAALAPSLFIGIVVCAVGLNAVGAVRRRS